MKKTVYAVLTSLLFLSSATFALANINTAPDATTVPHAQFGFYCNPYTQSFVATNFYSPTGGVCTYELTAQDMSKSNIFLGVYKGTVGNATLVKDEESPAFVVSTLQTQPNDWTGVQGDQFFAAAVAYDDFNDLLAEDAALRTGGPLPLPASTLSWNWGGPLPLTVVADNQTMPFGGPIPTLTASLSGFVDGNSNDVTGSANCSTTATVSSVAGDYPITCTLGDLASAGHYTFDTFVAGTLTVTPPPPPPAPTCSISADPASVVQGDSSTLTFSSTDADSASIDNGVGAVATAGTATVSPPSTTTYTDTVSGDGGTGTCSVTVTVTPPVVTDNQPPVIVITNPLKNGVYAKTDSVLLTATVTDASPLATTTYWFGTKKINPAQPLPLSTVSTPSIQSVSVSATDAYGNTSTTTLKFFVVKNTNSCLLDIIQVLILIGRDKTFPDKPTLQNLIADCSSLLKGLHRYDDDGHDNNNGHGNDNNGHNDQDDNHGGNNGRWR